MAKLTHPRRAALNACMGAALAALLAGYAQAETLLTVDAKKQPAAPRSEHLKMGISVSPTGATLGVNNLYLTRDGKPWAPVMGEFHYTRYPPQFWEEELLKMKASGVEVVASYIIWNHHEERAGEFNWTGDRDLKRFIDLCAKHGLKVVLRIGPWAHAEVRYGGMPDWIVRAMPSRMNDPEYLTYVKRYYAQIFEQAKGKLFKDGGPVIGIQLENEYNAGGEGRGEAHIATLKALAREVGFDVPLYTVTGWDNTLYPKGEVVPVFGGYVDEPWARSAAMLPPKETYAFRFGVRSSGDLGAQTASTMRGTAATDLENTPFLGAEYGPGLPVMYRRRPVVQPADIGAMLPVQLGSGANLFGYYMYHGGRNPAGHTDLEENDLLGGYNGVPIIGYDFQAPLGQYGQERPVMRAIRPFHLFLESFGDRMAPMIAHAPKVESTKQTDMTTARFSARSLGDRGFVFLNNYVRQYQMAPQADVRFEVQLPGSTVTFPSKPITIPSGAYFIWPVNFDLDGVNLAWASAQPLTRLVDGKTVTYVFVAEDGIAPEFAFDGKGVKVRAASGKVATAGGKTVVSGVAPGNDIAIRLNGPKGEVAIVVMTEAEAGKTSLVTLAGQTRLVKTEDQVFVGGDQVTLRSRGDNVFDLGVYPAISAAPTGSLPLANVKTTGIFQTWRAEAVAKSPTAQFVRTREPKGVAALKTGGSAGAAIQPIPEQFGRTAGTWEIRVAPGALDGLSDAYLAIDYQGDIARLFSGVEFLDDDFWAGPKWEIGLKRFKDKLGSPLKVAVMPLRLDAPIYLDAAYKDQLPKTGTQVADVKSVTVIPEYELTVGFSK